MRAVPLLAAVGFALSVLMAGCAEKPAAQAQAPAPTHSQERLSRPGHGGRSETKEPKEPAAKRELAQNVTLRRFSEEYDFQVTAASALVDIGSVDGRSCVGIEGAPFVITRGNATLTWAPQATDPALELDIRQVNGDYSGSFEGGSPLVVKLKDLPESDTGKYGDMFYSFSVQMGGLAGAAYQQDVHLALDVEYEADHDVSSTSSCY